ncbi:hypothetical protein ACFPIF_02420 [Brevundimonas faecalis]|uniref:hypothetical protein n=1 Tax=Brevundimonas faecalis TaxID=947378 RepID=UPI003612E636
MLAKVDGWLQGEANLSGKPVNSRAHAIRSVLEQWFRDTHDYPAGVELSSEQLAALDAWIAAYKRDTGQSVSRPQAVQMILKETLFV